MWAAVNANADLKKAVSDMLTEAKPTIIYNVYYLAASGLVQDNSKINLEYKETTSTYMVVAGTLQPMTLANGKQVIKVSKISGNLQYIISSLDAGKDLQKITIVDAMGKRDNNSSGAWNWLALNSYYHGTITMVIKMNVYMANDPGVSGTPSYEFPV